MPRRVLAWFPQKIIEVIQRFGHWIVPSVYMLIGAVIIIESGILGRLVNVRA